ncbi:hypothetical protein MANES_05G175601v8 [Manihot esculenta]|uniref:Uncharacterized protein n=1 Tax=Manihot esculenta TaxID=3983 RepID=A0ACB7HR56_MANES|nr:hypothetical protein MANES_05G175601v8 [Manihot esculenta]
MQILEANFTHDDIQHILTIRILMAPQEDNILFYYNRQGTWDLVPLSIWMLFWKKNMQNSFTKKTFYFPLDGAKKSSTLQ